MLRVESVDVVVQQWIDIDPIEVKTPNGSKVVSKVWYNGLSQVYDIVFHKNKVIEVVSCTGQHKFMLASGKWIEATHIDYGDELNDGWKVRSVILTDRLEPTFDIDVPEEHSYILSKGVITHNSSSVLCGSVSQSIEPLLSNTYKQKMAGGTVNRINPTLLNLMKLRGVYSQKMVDYIGIDLNGSIQHESIDWLTPHEKLVFKTAYEIDQEVIIDLAADRQKYICQSQSLNFFFKAEEKEEEVSRIHMLAMFNPNIKSLYYARSQSTSKGSSGKAEDVTECVACEA